MLSNEELKELKEEALNATGLIQVVDKMIREGVLDIKLRDIKISELLHSSSGIFKVEHGIDFLKLVEMRKMNKILDGIWECVSALDTSGTPPEDIPEDI